MTYKDKDKQAEFQKEHYQSKKEAYRSNLKKRRKERADWFVSLKSQLKCEICDEDHPATLDFHHNDSDDKFMSVGEMVGFAYSEGRILQEIAKCSVWCSNCHRKHHWREYKESI